MTPVSLTDAANIVKIQLNTATSWGASSENPKKYPETEITKAVQAAHDALAKMIAQTDGHPDQEEFETETAPIAHNDTIPSHIKIVACLVDNIYATEVTPSEVERLRANALGLVTASSKKFYALVGSTKLWHNGTNAVLHIIEFTATPGTGQISEAYLYAIVAKALALLFPHTGQNVQAASHYAALDARYTAMVIAGQAPPPVEQQ